MRSALRLGVISAIIALTFGQLDNHEPTHIVKFKKSVDRLSVNSELLNHHRDFLSSVRNVAAMGSNETIAFSAAAVEQVMSLDHIDLGPDFVAVAGVFSDHAFLDYLHQQNTVEYVEENQLFQSTLVRPRHSKARSPENRVIRTAKPANWGLARINQHEKGNLGMYDFDVMGGAGVEVYIMDTGVYVDHLDFEDRASHSANMIKNEDDSDMGGHGTHVAGKVAGHEYGVAKRATIKSVKILNKVGDGSTTSLLKGIEHVASNAMPGKAVVNLSLSGPRSRLLDDALNQLVLEYNVPVFVSAGNSGTDACFYSPSSNPNVFVVGATDINDVVPRFSNVGECVSIYAPGRDIVSTYIGGVDASKAMDGTSMASPHVAGIAANMLGKKSFASASDLYAELRAMATKDTITFDATKTSSPSNNVLAFNSV